MRVGIIGGDKRMLYAARAFAAAGDRAAVFCMDCKELPEGVVPLPLVEAAAQDIVILPPKPLDGEYLFAPLTDHRVTARELSNAVGDRTVFTGAGGSLKGVFRGRVVDYAAQEMFAVRNAVLTAEGAIGLLVERFEGSIFGSRALVTGYGRIGRILSRYLKALGADVTVAVRRNEARVWVTAEGMNACDYSFAEINRYSIIINTVPAPVLTAQVLDSVRRGAVIIDLASLPGGTDAQAARDRGLSFIHALALPGKTAPAAAGGIIRDVVDTIIKEENGGKDNCGLCDDRLFLHL